MLKIEPASETSDAELMRLVAAGDMTAFSTLIRRHQQAVRTLAYRVTGRVDAADDICQETFLRVLRGARSYQPAAAFTTWLHRIVVNLCLDRAKRPKLAFLDEDRPANVDSPDARLRHEEQAAAVQRAIAALPERQRIALVLHRFQGLSHAQVAESTGWSESAVEALLVRAYAQLRERLARCND